MNHRQPDPAAPTDAASHGPARPSAGAPPRTRRAELVWSVLAGLAGAGLFGVAFPPFGAWWGVFLAPLPVVLVGATAARWWLTALGVALAWAPMWAWHHKWIFDVTAAGTPLLVAYLAVWSGLFAAGVTLVRRVFPAIPLAAVAPIAALGLEHMRGVVAFDGYNWFLLAHPVIESELLTRLAPVLSVETLTLLVALPAGALADLVLPARGEGSWRASDRRWACSLGGVAAASVALTAAAFMPDGAGPVEGGRDLRVAVVQTSVPQDNRSAWTIERRLDDFGVLLELTGRAAAAGPDLIVWPETMFPGPTLSPDATAAQRDAGLAWTVAAPGSGEPATLPVTAFLDGLLDAQRGAGVPIVVGAIGLDGYALRLGPDGAPAELSEGRFNSAFVVAGGAVADTRYDKMHLTPFGEVMPYISAWPWLERRLLALGARGMAFDLDAGADPTVLEVPSPGGPVRVASPICFEITAPRVPRRLVWGDDGSRRAQLLVHLTNDGWFGSHRGGREHHLLHARWRAVEHRTPVARAANTGVSALIDAAGRVTTRARVGAERVVAGVLTLPPVGETDPWAGGRFGARGGWVAASLLGFVVFWAAAVRLFERRGPNARQTESGADPS